MDPDVAVDQRDQLPATQAHAGDGVPDGNRPPGVPSQREPAEPAATRPSRLRLPDPSDIAAAAAYLLLALWVTGQLWLDPGRRQFAKYPFDQGFFEWVFAHGVRVLTHGENPFFTTYLNAPDGVNMMANNSMLGLTIPFAPITVLFGAQISFLVATTGSLAGTAWAWYYVLSRHFVAARTAAFLGGAVCSFGYGMITHTPGQLNSITNFLIPFIVWRTLKLREPGRAVRNGLILGGLVTYQAFIGEEPLFITALALGGFVVCYAVIRPAEVRAAARPFLAGLGVATLLSAVVLAYPLYWQFFGPQHYRGIMTIASDYSATFSSFTGRQLPDLVAVDYTQDALTLTFTVLTLLIGVLLWSRVAVRALLITSGVFAVLSLGPVTSAENGQPGKPLPYRLLKDLPVFDSLVPARLQLPCLVIAGLLVAFGWEALVGAERATGRFATTPPVRRALAAALLALLIPAIPPQLPTAPVLDRPPFITDGTWKRYVPEGRTLIPVPLPKMGSLEGTRWSASTNLGFAVPAGYFFGPESATSLRAWYWPADRPTTTLLDGVADTGDVPQLTPDQRSQAVADIRYWRGSVVVLIPHPYGPALHNTLDDLLGRQGQFVGGVWIWDVRDLVP
jgi:hypothetical protein